MTKKLLILVFLLTPAWVFGQGWVGNGSSSLRAVNSTPANTPIQVGVGIAPLSRFHVSLVDLPVPQRSTLGIRFEGLNQNNALTRVLVTDNTGNLHWRDASSIGAGNNWLLLGNGGTNYTTNFLGTTDAQHLVFRTGNQPRVLVTGTLFGATPGNVGIGLGLGLPLTRVHGNGGLLFTGTAASTPIPAIGAGQRIVWYPDKAAFRSGTVTGAQWDGANVGINSFASGTNTTASGANSFAGGNQSTSSGIYSFAFGSQATSSGSNAVTFGQQSSALGSQSFALGSRVLTSATAGGSFVIGNGGSTILTNSIANSMMVGFNSNIPTLFVGPSAGTGTTGNVGIGNSASSPTAKLDVDGTTRVRNLPAGATTDEVVIADPGGNLRKLSFATLCAASPCGSASSCWNCTLPGITYLSNTNDSVGIGTTAPSTKLHVTGGGLFTGSAASTPIPALGAGQRMVWYPDKAAFRAGSIGNSDWDGANVGAFSTAFGNGAKASGNTSFAAGSGVEASGSNSVAIGQSLIVSGANATAFGFQNNVSGYASFATGTRSTITGDNSFVGGDANVVSSRYSIGYGLGVQVLKNTSMAMGSGTISNGESSFAGGTGSTTTADRSFAFGNAAKANGQEAVAFGNNTQANGSGSFAAGTSTIASGYNSVTFGAGNTSSGAYSASLGAGNNATGDFSFTQGASNTASGSFSMSMGAANTTNGAYAGTFGTSNTANGNFSFAFGASSRAGFDNSKYGSFALGQDVFADGNHSHALGNRVSTGSTTENSIVIGSGGGSPLNNNISRSLMVGFDSDIPTLFVGPSAGNGTTGNVGIGDNASSPTAKLDVDGTARVRNLPAGTTTDEVVIADAGGNLRKLPFSSLCAASSCGSPAASCWDCSGSLTFLTNLGHNVGIGTTTPTTKLHATGGALFTGVAGDAIPVNGDGRRMMWYPGKAAFRAGNIIGGFGQWDDFWVGEYSFATGQNTRANGTYSFAAGNNAVANGTASFAAGETTVAGNYAFATGQNTGAGNYAFVAGQNSSASGVGSFAVGQSTSAQGIGAAAFGGPGTLAQGTYSLASGTSAQATGNYSVAFGNGSFAGGQSAFSLGQTVSSNGLNSFVSGVNSSSLGNNSFLCGNGTNIGSNGHGAVAFGYQNYSNGENSLVMGNLSQATGNLSIAAGFNCQANAENAIALGRSLRANGSFSTVFGMGGVAGLTNNIAQSIMMGTGSDSASFYISPSSNPFNGTGNIGIGTANPQGKLDVNGNAVPHNPGVFDLGTPILSWRDLYLSNSPTITSDARLKQNVQGLLYGINEIKRLRPVSYALNSNAADTKLGLIAQEVREVISEVVKEGNDLDKTLGIQYSDLIPVLIKGIQEQQVMIETLEAKIETLENNNFAPSSEKTLQTISGMTTEVVKIYQNNPNPFDETTEIKYFIPEQVSEAKLYIYNLTGTELKSIGIKERGTGSVQIDAGALAAGMYLYTIIADGQETETKRMILTK